jgi:polyhydroxybutyrate depolymerase
MTIRKVLLSAVLVLLGLALTVMLIVVAWISILDDTNGTLVVAGGTREYLIHVPQSYDPSEPTSLVLSLHAGATWPAHQMHLSHWNALADEHGFIVVYPSGTPMLFGIVRVWRTTPGTVRTDVEFIAALIDTLETAYNIDPTRIYANGMSLGGGLVFALACTLPDRIAAVGLVAAAQSLPSDWCPDTRPVPLMAFHGDADPIVPYAGGPLGDPFNPVKPVYPSVRDWVVSRARWNGCTATPTVSAVAPDVVRTTYADCVHDADVVLHTLIGGGHSWPGGKPPPAWRVGATSTSIDATAELWAFFQEHPLRHR